MTEADPDVHGSGMPRNLWAGVTERSRRRAWLEFYASADRRSDPREREGHADRIDGAAVLPGTAEVRVAAFDRRHGAASSSADNALRARMRDGRGRPARHGVRNAVGLHVGRGATARSFEPDDAWRSTGDLFLRDEHRDLWLVDAGQLAGRHRDGTGDPRGRTDGIGVDSAVDLLVAYGVPDRGAEVLVGAVTLMPGS